MVYELFVYTQQTFICSKSRIERSVKVKKYMFKVNYEDTRTKSVTSFWCRYCQLITYLTPFSSFSIVEFEQVNVCWEV